MGRSQVLYNQRAGRSRGGGRTGTSTSARGEGREGGVSGRGRGTGSTRDDRVYSSSNDSATRAAQDSLSSTRPLHVQQQQQQQQQQQHESTPSSTRGSSSAFFNTTVANITSDLEAEHLLSLGNATSIYASQASSSAHGTDSHQLTPSFLRSSSSSTKVANTQPISSQTLCSRMSRVLESLPRSEQWRMPRHLLETIYGAEKQVQSKVVVSNVSATTAINNVQNHATSAGATAAASATNPLKGQAMPSSHQASTTRTPPPSIHNQPSVSRPWVEVTDLTATILGDDEMDDDHDHRDDHNGGDRSSNVVYLGTKHGVVPHTSTDSVAAVVLSATDNAQRSATNINVTTVIDDDDEGGDLDSWLDTVIS